MDDHGSNLNYSWNVERGKAVNAAPSLSADSIHALQVYLEEQEALGKARAQEAVSAHVSLFTSLTSTAGKDSKGQRAAGKSFKGNIGGKSLKGNIGAKSFKVKKSHVVSGGDAHGCPPDGGKRHGAQEHHTGPVVQSLEHCLQPPAEAAWQGRSSG